MSFDWFESTFFDASNGHYTNNSTDSNNTYNEIEKESKKQPLIAKQLTDSMRMRLLIFGYLRSICDDIIIHQQIIELCLEYSPKANDGGFIFGTNYYIPMEQLMEELIMKKSIKSLQDRFSQYHGENMTLSGNNTIVHQISNGSNTVYGTKEFTLKNNKERYEWVFKILECTKMISIGIDLASNRKAGINKNYTNETSFFGYWDDPNPDALGYSYDNDGNFFCGGNDYNDTKALCRFNTNDYIRMIVGNGRLLFYKNIRKMHEIQVHSSVYIDTSSKWVMAVSMSITGDVVQLMSS